MKNDDSRKTRTYNLAHKDSREEINLKNYEDIITEVVHDVIPEAKIIITEHSYTIDKISRGEAIAIGRILSRYFMDAAVIRYSVFVSHPDSFDNILEESKDGRKEA